jgi:uncharacterized membrane protein HdeD (DUF308 family)
VADPTPSLNTKQTTLFRTMAVCDLFAGIGLVVAGYATDETVLVVIGLALLVSGAGVAAFLSWRASQPTKL